MADIARERSVTDTAAPLTRARGSGEFAQLSASLLTNYSPKENSQREKASTTTVDGLVVRGAASNGPVKPMKEDILEQIVDDYLQFKGYFTTHNVRFKPDPAHPDYVADLAP